MSDSFTAAQLAARFPADFIWGAATAAAQIEGSVAADGRTPSIWDTFAARPGAVAGGDTPSTADDHYRLWAGDVRIMKEIGLDAYRFSVSWPRIVPEADGRIESRGLDFYERLVDGLLAADIDPFLTLYHWDLPEWQQQRGGWPSRDTAYRFAEFAGAVVERLGDRVRSWTTLNEPFIFTFLGHLEGIHAPGVRDESAAVSAMHHALLGHGLAMSALRAALPADAQVGIALSMTPAEAATDSASDQAAAERYSLYRNWLYLHPIMRGEYHPATAELFTTAPSVQKGDLEIISEPIDFVGINYYARGVVTHDDAIAVTRARLEEPVGEYTAMGWEVHAPGLESIITETHLRYGPAAIYVTENGSAWNDEVGADGSINDERRVAYLGGHLEAAARARAAGAPLAGYFAWSLLDNFEWAEGYAKRFGLVHVDYDTQRRTMKRSGAFYRQVITAMKR
ncbi:GH1 family beta-glucosidase [Microbacterium sp. MYb45]|uniref:GH1 family beta-glucosidase n=1 Tax=Microbacterium sp. MYb45 TaxID=1827294 RepID=UPI000CFF19A9|nr:GH1 family beta-glucosidase [Microbacterium sp. MYb45]PRB65667.1 beta-glucosidase [Microbacterium sp. MYb45]